MFSPAEAKSSSILKTEAWERSVSCPAPTAVDSIGTTDRLDDLVPHETKTFKAKAKKRTK